MGIGGAAVLSLQCLLHINVNSSVNRTRGVGGHYGSGHSTLGALQTVRLKKALQGCRRLRYRAPEGRAMMRKHIGTSYSNCKQEEKEKENGVRETCRMILSVWVFRLAAPGRGAHRGSRLVPCASTLKCSAHQRPRSRMHKSPAYLETSPPTHCAYTSPDHSRARDIAHVS